MQFSFTRLCTAMLLGSTLVGCAAVVKTPYQAPSVQTPAQFQYGHAAAQQRQQAIYADQWWTLFGDTQLNQLIDEVLAKNTDLAVAGITLKQARLQADLSANQQKPRVSSTLSTGHSFDLNNGSDASSGLSTKVGLSYELDLFGKLARQTEAKKWEALATEQDLQATAQSLVGTTAKLYWQLAYYHESRSTTQQSLATSQKLYDLVKAQYQAGSVSGLELTQAEQSVQSQKASLSQIQQNLVETR
ncbi:MAG TPA: TolC family protein, partial [Acinetobacter sp.]|nr:TolC family protein [Acinetobacter sp.]